MEGKYKVLEGIPEKNKENKDTTSLKWKKDLIDFFHEKKLKNCLELGTANGITTKVLSSLFDEVHTIESMPKRFDKAKQNYSHIKNITFHLADGYSDLTYRHNNFPQYFDAVVIDADHQYHSVIMDISRALKFFNKDKGIYLVFDDYGHPESTGVKKAVEDAIRLLNLKIVKEIGEEPGFTVHRVNNTEFTLIHKEGIILSYGI
tara:strand:+ start:396 stop:1007 length:612 start_codon:yes stop_codon:yes gene_type:complete